MQNEALHTLATEAGCFRLAIRVYYEDTDAGAVVYYANYLKFCERARTEWLRTLGVEQHALLQTQRLAFVVRKVTADYLAPARLDDRLEVVTRITRLGRAGLDFSQNILRGPELLFSATISIACVDLERQRPHAIPEPLRTLLHDTQR